jgi:hypothetical protein
LRIIRYSLLVRHWLIDLLTYLDLIGVRDLWGG